MKRIGSIVGTLVFLFVLSAVNVHAQSMDKIRKQIEKNNAKMKENMLSGDHLASLALYTEEALSLPSYQPMVKGMQALKKTAEEMANMPMKILSFDVTIDEIIPGGNLYVEVGKYKMSTQVEGMGEPWKDHGKYVTVWEKQKDGSLKIKVETWNTDTNPWMQ